FLTLIPPPPTPPPFPYTTLFRSDDGHLAAEVEQIHGRTSQKRRPASLRAAVGRLSAPARRPDGRNRRRLCQPLTMIPPEPEAPRSEEHTSELQSRGHLVCRLLLE